jgi:hypothetical protein
MLARSFFLRGVSTFKNSAIPGIVVASQANILFNAQAKAFSSAPEVCHFLNKKKPTHSLSF